MGHQNAIGGKSPLQAKAHIFPPFLYVMIMACSFLVSVKLARCTTF